MGEERKKLRNDCFRFFKAYNKDIRTKLGNICGKTGRYNVPKNLYQSRTSRRNRILISWRAVKNNKLTIEMLKSFNGGVVVEFLNNDIFNEENQKNPIFIELKDRIGSDDIVSAMISFRTEEGSSSSAIQREAFERFLNNTTVKYKGEDIVINKDNYMNYAIKRVKKGGTGNEKWDGFIFVSIRGGQQDVIETHHDKKYTLFNPACEYANESVSIDIDLVLSYFTLKSIDVELLKEEEKIKYTSIMKEMEKVLAQINYNLNDSPISLFDYCSKHPSVLLQKGELTDPIQIRKICIENFKIKDNSPDSIDLTHNEAINLEKYYWDSERKCVLSPARPTNVFWSYHLSNMMQQNFTISEYLKHEEEIYIKRKKLAKFYNLK